MNQTVYLQLKYSELLFIGSAMRLHDQKIAREIIHHVECAIKQSKELNPSKAVALSCTYFGITNEELLSKSRKREISDARMCISMFLKERFGMTLNKIGKMLNRDHTSIMHHVDMIANCRELSEKYRSYKLKITKDENI